MKFVTDEGVDSQIVEKLKKVHSGIILNRLYELTSASKAELVSKVVEKYGMNLHGSFTVIQPGRIRIRKLN